MAKIFISYKRVDKDIVFDIKDRIDQALGFTSEKEKCWIDLDGIESDEAFFETVIIRAINECEIFLFMYSQTHAQIKDYKNDWTVKELKFAETKQKRIVFVNIDRASLTDWFAFNFPSKQQIDAQSEESMSLLIRDLRKWLHLPAINAVKAGIPIDAVHFPDENFRNYLLEQDYGKDGILTEEKIKEITSIGYRVIGINNNTIYIREFMGNVISLKGIEVFTELTSLDCSDNQLTELDVSKNTKLTELDCSNNQLTALDVSKNTKLTSLDCSDNQLTELDVSKNTELKRLNCLNNQLTELDVSKNTELKGLHCSDNQLTELDVSSNTMLEYLDCSNNQLTALDISSNTELEELGCDGNQFKKLDISKNTALKTLRYSTKKP